MSSGADDDENVESGPEQTARSNENVTRKHSTEPVPACSLDVQQHETQEHEDVLQSGEAVLEE